MTFISDTLHLLRRHIMTTLRIPIWIVVTLVQPIVWLALYGQLFQKVVEIPGFQSTSYIQFLTPGVVIMTAFFGAAWSGMGILQDLTEGVMDRMLASPVRRGALILSRVLHSALTVTVQAVIILIVGLVLGARFPGGVAGIVAILVLGALLGASFAALSNGIALLTRREETLIAVLNFFGLPLLFLSAAFMASSLMPHWIQTIAKFNPVNWAVVAGRNATLGVNWSSTGIYTILLLAFVVVCAMFATQAFRFYRRTT